MNAHIQVVGYSDRTSLAACLRSCLGQKLQAPIVYVDNASTDESVEFVRAQFPTVRVIANAGNRGYSGGHNDALQAMPGTDVAIVLNPDVVLTPDFVERGLAAFTRDRIGAVAPLLFRSQTSEVGSQIVDAYGTVLLRSLRAVNQFEGESLSDLRSPISEFHPWGYTGAAAFLRRRALEDVAIDGEIFDEDLFAYREDVDLSWRLRLRGWDIQGAPNARATHARAARAGTGKDPLIAQLSWRNYYLVLVKDVPLRALFRHAPAILLEDLARDLQWLTHPALWPALPDLLRLLPRFLRKRAKVLARTGIVRGLFTDEELLLPRFPDGRINYHRARTAPVVTCVVRRGGDILLLKRGEKVSTYKGRWHVVAGYLDEPGKMVEEKAREELREEIGIHDDDIVGLQIGRTIEMDDPQLRKLWRIHPVLVDVKGDPPITLDWEHTDYRWVQPEEIPDYHPIPGLVEVLRRRSRKN